MDPIRMIVSRVVSLPARNVDTDQIIPARYLKGTDKVGLGEHLFADWRYLADGTPNPDFVLNRPDAFGAQILLAGDNFGCGSSREHAPWALLGWGFRAVIATSFADIFRNNSLKNGLLPVIAPESFVASLRARYLESPTLEVCIDLSAQTVSYLNQSTPFPMDPFVKKCLLQGVDELGFLLAKGDLIHAWENQHSSRRPTTREL